jgi:hypothetical protein
MAYSMVEPRNRRARARSADLRGSDYTDEGQSRTRVVVLLDLGHL